MRKETRELLNAINGLYSTGALSKEEFDYLVSAVLVIEIQGLFNRMIDRFSERLERFLVKA